MPNTTMQLGLGQCMGGETVPSVPLWTSFHTYHRSPAINNLFSPQRPMSATAASRLQRQALFLSMYSYSIKYRGTTQHSNADALSRLPMQTEEGGQKMDDFGDVEDFMVKQIEYLPVTAGCYILGPPTCKSIHVCVQSGWPTTVPDELKPYFDRRHEFIEQGCLMWGMSVLIPQKYQSKVLDELHGGHLGTVKMKATCVVAYHGQGY